MQPDAAPANGTYDIRLVALKGGGGLGALNLAPGSVGTVTVT
jgi:hypothetical protein